MLRQHTPYRDPVSIVCGLLLIGSMVSGCLSEQSMVLRADESRRVKAEQSALRPIGSTRDWLRAAHAQLADLLPPGHPKPLLTEDLATADGNPVDVYDHFGIARDAGAEARMREFLSDHQQGKHGAHRYTLEQFGLDPERESERFRFYQDYYRVAAES